MLSTYKHGCKNLTKQRNICLYKEGAKVLEGVLTSVVNQKGKRGFCLGLIYCV